MREMVYKRRLSGAEVLHSGSHQGFDFIILNLGTHPTAYVRLPTKHEYFGKDYSYIDIDTHGGLTYASDSVTGSNKKGWWIGWDYAHSGDYTYYDSYSLEGKRYTTLDVLDDVKDVIEQLKPPIEATK